MEDADGFTLNNVWLDFKTGPVLFAKNSKNIQVEKVTTASPAGLFISAAGEKTENIRLLLTDVSKAKKDVELGPGVRPGAVVIQ